MNEIFLYSGGYFRFHEYIILEIRCIALGHECNITKFQCSIWGHKYYIREVRRILLGHEYDILKFRCTVLGRECNILEFR